MQISTIDVRTEGIDRPSGGKKGNSGETSADSGFAAFFATQLDAQRQPKATATSSTEEDPVLEIDSASNEKAVPKALGKLKRHAESDSIENSSEEAAAESTSSNAESSADVNQAESVAAVAVQPRQAASSAKFSVVSKDGTAVTVKLNVNAAQPLVTVAAKEVAPVASAPSPLSAAQADATQTVPAIIAPLVQTGLAIVEPDPQVEVTPLPAPKSDVAAADGSAKADAIEVPSEAPAITTDDLGGQKEQGAGDDSAGSFAGSAEKLPVSKLQSHALTPNATPTQTVDKSVNAEPKISVLQSTDSAEVVQATPQDDLAGDAVDSIAAAPDKQKADSQVMRNVTQVVSQDGTIVATRSTEVRSEHAQAAGQREVVVIEKTTIQALPEQALRGARFLLSNAEQTMRIRLVPESLGEVRLEIIAARGDVTVKLASANAAVREILQTHAPGLQHAIAQDNTGNVRVTVSADVGSSAWLSSNAQRNSGQQDTNGQAQANHRGATPSLYRDANPTTTATPRREAAHAGNLNVYV